MNLTHVSSKPDVVAQIHNHMFAKYHHFETIQKALVYMVLKGDVKHMEELGLYKPKGNYSTSPDRCVQQIFIQIHLHLQLPL